MKDNGVPDLFIEKLLLDELPQDMKERLLRDPSVRRRLEELKAENRRILEEYPPEEMAKAIRNRERWSRRTEEAQSARVRPEGRRLNRLRLSLSRLAKGGAPMRRPNWPRLVPVASFALLVLVGGLLLITRAPSHLTPQDRAAETRLKGGAPHLNIYMQTDAGARLLEEGDRVTEGTTLQVGYVSGANEYGVIVSIDGGGTVTLHFPLSAVTGQALEGEGEVLLPYAYILDDAPDFERFFFIVSKKPFSVETVLEAAETLSENPETAQSQGLRLPRRLEQSSILLLK
jgi:hypothetical protein